MHSEKVAKSLIAFYLQNKQNLSREKEQYLIDGIGSNCSWHENSLLLFPPSKEIKRRILSFEKYVKKIDPQIYTRMETDSKAIAILRKTSYHTYRLASIYVRNID